jgi:hypothetical protein
VKTNSKWWKLAGDWGFWGGLLLFGCLLIAWLASKAFGAQRQYTPTPNIQLHMKVTDAGSGMRSMDFAIVDSQIGSHGPDDVVWMGEEPYPVPDAGGVAIKALTLPDGDKIKTVYCRFYDNVGWVWEPVIEIGLDTKAPGGTYTIPGSFVIDIKFIQ